jgi:hypothetical protein
MGCLAAFSSCGPRLFLCKLMRRSLLVGCLATLARDFALFRLIHTGEASFLSHIILRVPLS